MRAHDWSTSPLGRPEAWPQSLRSALSICLSTPVVSAVYWGPELCILYNDAYAPVLAERHPWALGRPIGEVWAEIWDVLGPQIESVLVTGQGFSTESQLLRMERRGRLEDTWWVYSFAPIRGEEDSVVGIFVTALDTTAQVRAEHRQSFRLALEQRLRDLADPREMMATAAEMLGQHLGADRAGYAEIDANDATFVVHDDWTAGGLPSLAGRSRMDDFGPALMAELRAGREVAFEDARTELLAEGEAPAATLLQHEIRAALTVPLVKDGRFAAALYVHFREPHRWTDQEKALATEVAERAWAAVERARAEAELRASETRLGFLDRLGAETAPLGDAEAVLATTTRRLSEHLNLSVCAYADMDEDEDGFTIRGDWAEPGSTSIVGHYSLADFGKLAVRNLSAGLPLVVNDNRRELAPEEAAAFQNIGIAATICMPLVKEGRLTALMAIHDRVPRAWTEAELSLLREVTARSWAHVERFAAVAELRASEARFRLTADAVPQIVWITDAEGRAEFFNKQWSDYTGVPYEPTTAAEVAANHVHPDDAATTVAAFDEARRTGTAYLVEHRIRSAAGEYRWFLVRGEPYLDPQTGKVVRWFGASTDIDDRRRAEAALRNSEARLTRALEVGELGAWELDLATLAAWRSPQHDRIFGYDTPLPEWTYEVFLKHVVPGDRERVDAAFQEAIVGRGRWDFECRVIRLDGEQRWIWAQGKVDAGAGGEPGRMKGMVRDVTERHRAEEALRESEARLRAVIDAAPIGLVFADATGRITGSNAQVEKIIGQPITRSDDAGRYGDDYIAFHVDGHRVEGHEYPLAQVLRGEVERAELEVQVQLPDESRRWVRYIATPMKDERGGIIGAVAASLDIGREKRFAEDLACEVQRAVAELETAQEQLRQSQKLEAVGQLTGGVAHDFNNLLTVIRGSVELLLRPNLSEENRQRYIHAIADTASRATKLTSQLLAFARRQALRPEVFDVGRNVAAVADMIHSLVGARLTIETDAPEGLFVNADPSQLDTALVNMAVNARDAMDGEGRLGISVKHVKAVPAVRGHPPVLGDFVAVCLSDTGTGMAPDQVERIFEPFFTTKQVGKGTGLGLSQVYGFAKQSGGEITVESELGRGSRFTLYLPQVLASGELRRESGAAEPLVDGRGACVLVVEDNREVGEFAVSALGELGYRTTLAENAEDALEKLTKSREGIQAVFSDVVMPGMNGIDLAREIQRRYPDLPVLLASGYSHVLAETGPDGFELLHKPYSIEQLSRVLRKITTRESPGSYGGDARS